MSKERIAASSGKPARPLVFVRPTEDHPKVGYAALPPYMKRQVWLDIQKDAAEISAKLGTPNRLEAILSPRFHAELARLCGV